ncbi:Deoxycytidine monophosphate (dCMP) deaminase [Coemansia javaensis]|uniref:Deoxycytidylate deaminase n=1 Tax=Coemansia javaensis TaxID=2761396 RepID=A0A9W8HLF8_9FUNG|nr:Deoxycytidine monophosphate (dCMP) deaminase [Coemansia javaensis]
MFIIIIGTKASGKETVAEYLAAAHGFERVRLAGRSAGGGVTLATADDVLKYVTPRWRTDYVTTDVDSPLDLYRLWKRPFVLVVGVDAPIGDRYRRYCLRAAQRQEQALALDGFVAADDGVLYRSQAADPRAGADAASSCKSPLLPVAEAADRINLKRALAGANVSIENTFGSVAELHAHLERVDLTNYERLRPSWDTYFMLLSELAAHRSNCMKRRVGCILVKDHQIIATGYNGTPKGVTNCNAGGCPRCNAGTPCGVSLDHCLCIHAEENALLEAGRGRVRTAQDVVLYCNTCPCLGCAKKIVQVGVKVVVYSKGYGMDDLTLRLFAEAGVVVRQHTPPVLTMGIGMP